MSFGGLPWSFYDRLAKSQGAYTQLPLFETPPHFEIDEEYLCSVPQGINCVISETGSNYSTMGSVDHPMFDALRKHLNSKGYIEMETNWCNGDRVTKEFYLNGVLFEVDEQFSCASAMSISLKRRENE